MSLEFLVKSDSPILAAGTPAGFDGYLLGQFAERHFADHKDPVIFIARDDARLAATRAATSFFHPDLDILTLPAWDCLPYDRVGPASDIVAQRMESLSRLVAYKRKTPLLLLTTISAVLQRVPPRSHLKAGSLILREGLNISQGELLVFLSQNGFNRTSQVLDKGEFAVRGGLIDLFPASMENPVRLDFFGDEIDAMRSFDPTDQRTIGKVQEVPLLSASEITLTPDAVQHFVRKYLGTFGPSKGADPLYEAIKEGRKLQGAEHWLPFFHEKLETIFDFTGPSRIVLDHQASEAAGERLTAISDYYAARREALKLVKAGKGDAEAVYKPVPVESLFLSEDEWTTTAKHGKAVSFSPFPGPEGEKSIDFKATASRSFAPERQTRETSVYDALKDHVATLQEAGHRVIFACYSEGSAERMASVLSDHGLAGVAVISDYRLIRTSSPKIVACSILPIEHGFTMPGLAVITEQDILGDRLVRSVKKRRKADNFLTEASALSVGDYVVHSSHGIGQFTSLETLEISNARHDCLLLTYAGGDKLYVPVENIEVLSRYGDEDTQVQLDKLGGVAWQARKAKMKARVREMADGLIKLAAERALKEGTRLTVPEGLYDEFCARFPYSETEDQLNAIADVITDLTSGKPMDRLVCGDVGFGKTEVALRAAFMAVMAGYQVVVVAPTTLLARQHYQTFAERFKHLPVRVGQLSRLVKPSEATLTKNEIAKGQLDIVIGTHALLGKDIHFTNLGLLIVDEEQHFGVAHKEKLKSLKAGVHVLTLTATPIPRTLQMSMTGIRDLSLIATPPVDRLAVRTYVLPFDHVVIREALLREHYRGGQSFYVVPRITDLEEISLYLREHVPEVKFIAAHGQMAPTQLEKIMTAFYEGEYDVLLSTTIIESGIDIPSANTMIVHRADMFGLAQLYQIRGRVGRSKIRAYAYLTKPAGRLLSDRADKRLQVLQSLDTLGAGFSIASHDMDIRGAGNLLGEEQSGQVREVGVELYQKMLEEAVAQARAGTGDMEDVADADWSPTINLGATVMIPESYVPDLDTRMALYRRLADITSAKDVDSFLAELIDRFGKLPGAVKQLAAIMVIKSHAKNAGIEKLEAGPKGLVITFKDHKFVNPAGLVQFISSTGTTAKVRPDHSLVYHARMEKTADRLKTAASIARKLAQLAEDAA